MRRLVSALMICALLAACGSATENSPTVFAEPAGDPVLKTPCFDVGPQLQIPDGYIAADVSPNDSQCWFVTQAEGRADTTVIAGELWKSSGGNSFAEFVELMRAGLSQGQEPDLLPLQVLNTGPTGRDLPIVETIELDGPNRATIFVHESDRRDGFQAMSAVVDFNTARQSDTTVIFMWGLVNTVNLDLFPDLINAMELKRDFQPN